MEFLNVLSREEMRNIKGGLMPTWTCECEYGDDCHVEIDQYDNHWEMTVRCGNAGSGYSGTGNWAGSACGGGCVGES
ncbi:MAG: hypothetical protein JJ958_03215 [Balneola sp.]|jgi:natural product precursor|nr:hypothetical protein [Balneola sp.]